jgi:transaldolase
MPDPNAPLAALVDAGVSIWLDDLSRGRLESGGLAALIRDRHVTGVTTNPTIFAKALAQSGPYAAQLADLAVRGVAVEEAVRALTTYDVRWACDVLAEVAAESGGLDGRVSIEVDPRLARDGAATLAEARALWWAVDRPNLLIKIPATAEGLPAVTACLAEGISVNVTLIFALDRYRDVLDAWLSGLEAAAAAGRELPAIASVASFFVSRVDTEVDARLDRIGTPQAAALRGTAAIANARLAHEAFTGVMAGPRWAALAALGARPQRPLWASTGVKDPAYDDTRYVVDLVTSGTVNTMPEATLDAVADHGRVRGDTVASEHAAAHAALAALAALGIDYADVVAVLEDEGVRKFEDSWAELLVSVERALASASAKSTGAQA